MMDMGMSMLPQQQMKVSPSLITLNSMLTLSAIELHQLVQTELSENPALEQAEVDEGSCSVCHRPLISGICLFCAQEQSNYVMAERENLSGGQDDELDPLLLIAAPVALYETLQQDLLVSLNADEYAIADFLLGSINERGYLDIELRDVAQTLQVDESAVEHVLKQLQELAPPGVGARDLLECLHIQIKRLEQAGISHPLVAEIVETYWSDLGNHRYSDIARVLKVTYDDIVAARDFIREYLRPYPLQSINEGDDATAPLMPDVVIFQHEDRFVVEVVESRQYVLRVNAAYHTLTDIMSQERQALSDEERNHISTYVSRARVFLSHLRQRRDTIRRITEYLIEHQDGFLRQGIRHLQPLTRGEVAAVLGLHESTISRATANKYVQLPNRSIVPFSSFFRASLPVKDIMKELVDQETTALTDDQIVAILHERGIDIARRTVAKYRAQLGILPSHLR